MATSGSINYTVTRDDIITEALSICGVLAEGDTPNSDTLTNCARTLNMLVKSWQVEGLNLWAMTTGYLFLEASKQVYTLGSSGDHFTSSYGSAVTNAAATSGATTVSVSNAATFILDTDYIGIELDTANTIQWTQANGISGDNITITDALTDDVASGNTIYYYSTKANRPLQILECVTRNNSGTDSDVDIITRAEYHSLSSKSSGGGGVSEVYYDPQVSAGKLYVWPTATDEKDILVMKMERTLEDFDAATDDADFPQEWYLPLAYNLALLIAPKYGVVPEVFDRVEVQARYWKELSEGFDREPSVFFLPDTSNA